MISKNDDKQDTIAAVSSFIVLVSIQILFLAEFYRRREERLINK